MSEFKGTGGKWSASENSCFYEINTDLKDRYLGFHILLLGEQGQRLSLTDENKANALLISKAPELLECLQGLSDAISNGNSSKLSEYNFKAKKLIHDATTL